jgi:hypothetical protein
MEPVVGIYPSRAAAEQAARRIHALGLGDRVELLLPGEKAMEESLPTDGAEQPGVGQALGGVVGAAAGASAGFGVGAVATSLLIPGVGAVTAIGIAAAALLGLIGAAGGAAAGSALEEHSREGLPRDEAYLYEDALSRGKGVLFAKVESREEESAVRQLLDASGAESLDVAREKWWVGIRDPHGESAATDSAARAETAYRRGFLAALQPDMEGKAYADVMSILHRRSGDVVLSESYRRGFLRGNAVAATRSATLASAEDRS